MKVLLKGSHQSSHNSCVCSKCLYNAHFDPKLSSKFIIIAIQAAQFGYLNLW